MKRILTIAALAAGVALAGGAAVAIAGDPSPGGFGPGFMRDGGPGMPMQGMGPQGMMDGRGPGTGTAGPGAAGPAYGPMHGGDATFSEMGGIHTLLANHERVTRTVADLPDGIRTVTESDDPAVAQTIKEHVATMIQRIGEKRDLGLPIESPALHALFGNSDKIKTEVETTDKGVVVTQTSDDAATVALLQKHAAEINDLAQRGMLALHERMASNAAMPHPMAGGGMMGGMMGGMHGHGPAGVPPMMRQGVPSAPANPPAEGTR